MGDYHLFRGVLPQQAILIAPDGRAFVIDKESVKHSYEPETWTTNIDLEGQLITGQDVLALCEANERLYAENAQARLLLEEARLMLARGLIINDSKSTAVSMWVSRHDAFLAQQKEQEP